MNENPKAAQIWAVKRGFVAVFGIVLWHQNFENPLMTDLRKTNSSGTILCSVPTEIHNCTEMPSVVTHLPAKNEYIY